MNRYVLGFYFSHMYDNVVLIEKQRPDWQKGKLNGVGGAIQEGESDLDAMVREFKEEVGADVRNWVQYAILQFMGDSELPVAEVVCFMAVGSFAENNLWHFQEGERNSSGEIVKVVSISNLEAYRYSALADVPWLIEMARSGSYNKYTIQAVDSSKISVMNQD